MQYKAHSIHYQMFSEICASKVLTFIWFMLWANMLYVRCFMCFFSWQLILKVDQKFVRHHGWRTQARLDQYIENLHTLLDKKAPYQPHFLLVTLNQVQAVYFELLAKGPFCMFNYKDNWLRNSCIVLWAEWNHATWRPECQKQAPFFTYFSVQK